MLVTVGGAERRPAEFKRILQASGLDLVAIHKGSGPAAAYSAVPRDQHPHQGHGALQSRQSRSYSGQILAHQYHPTVAY
eukprot:scaffold297559_cov36-Prasinocladus_malaysianus.AAC.1